MSNLDLAHLKFLVVAKHGGYVVSAHQHPDAAERFRRSTGFPDDFEVKTLVEADLSQLEFLVVSEHGGYVVSAHQHPDAAERFRRTTGNPEGFAVKYIGG